MCAGAAFAAAGLQMQTMFRNPLAGPWILGVTAGAKLGVGIIVVAAGAAGAKFIASPMLGVIGNLGMAGGACLGAALVFGAILFLSRRVSAITLLIIGLMFGFLADGLLDFILYFSSYAHYQMFHAWTHESFSGLTWNKIRALVAVTLAGLTVALLSVKALNALLLGERYAHSMGESVGRARFLCMASTVGMSATVTAFCGPIMFLDLAVPHLCRGLFNTSDHRTLMPGVILMGAALALAGDVIINQPGMYKALHVNAINTMIGVPVVLWIIFRRKQMRALEL
jgi:iron complex transport system permease protein